MWRYAIEPGPWFNIKMSSYQYRKSHCGDKTILRPSYLHNGISYTCKMTSLYWIRALFTTLSRHFVILRMSHKICTCFGCALFYWGYIVRLNIYWYYHNKTRCKRCAEFLWCTTSYWYVASCSAPDCHVSCKRYQLIIRLRKILLLYCLLHSL